MNYASSPLPLSDESHDGTLRLPVEVKGLANSLAVERYYTPDRNGMLAALRVVLGLPKAPPQWLQELGR